MKVSNLLVSLEITAKKVTKQPEFDFGIFDKMKLSETASRASKMLDFWQMKCFERFFANK